MHPSSHRDRHSRGFRGPLFSRHLPAQRTRSELFAQTAAGVFARVQARAGRSLDHTELRIDFAPPADAAEGPELGRVYPSRIGRGHTLVIFYLPIARHAESHAELLGILGDVISEQAALITNRDADELNPF